MQKTTRLSGTGRWRTVLRRFSIVSFLLLILSGCGSEDSTTREQNDVETQAATDEPTEAPTDATGAEFETPYELSLGTAVSGAFFIPMYVALEAGYYEEEGLDVDLLVFDGGGDLMAAMASRSVDVAGGASASLISAVAQGIEARAVYGLLNTLPYDVIVGDGIDGWDDLRGKTAGVSGPGSLTDTAVRMSLEANGVVPDDDITILDAGGGDAPRLAALSTGQIHMTVANPGSRPQYDQVGAEVLLAAEDFDLPFQGNAIVANTAFIEEQPEVMEAVVRATMRGAAALQDPELEDIVKQAIEEHVGVDDPEVIDALYDYASADNPAIFPINGEISEEGVRTILEQRAEGEPAVAELDLDDVIDTTFIDDLADYAAQLEAEGP